MLNSPFNFSKMDWDDPTGRLVVTLPLSVFILMVMVVFVSMLIQDKSNPPPPALPIDAQMMDLSGAALKQPMQKKVEKTPQKQMPVPPIPKNEVEKSVSKMKAQDAKTSDKAPNSDEKPNASSTPSASHSAQTGNNGARALIQPMPEIPESLREEAMKTQAVARFQIAVDGSVSVELIKPTPNPSLNRLLLNSLKNWRFFPAQKDGVPVASSQDIVIKINVK